MSRQILWALGAAGFLVLAGCNKAASPETVQNDVAKATDSAAEKDRSGSSKRGSVSEQGHPVRAGQGELTDSGGSC